MITMLIALLVGCNGAPPERVGMNGFYLHECPKGSACFSSTNAPDDKDHFIEPINVEEPGPIAIEKFLKIAKSQSTVKIIEEKPMYIRLEVTEGTFGGIKDVELLFSPETNNIQVRSYSRFRFPFGHNHESFIEGIKFRYFQQDIPN